MKKRFKGDAVPQCSDTNNVFSLYTDNGTHAKAMEENQDEGLERMTHEVMSSL